MNDNRPEIEIEMKVGIDEIGELATVLSATIDSFCAHPATGEYSYGHILSALTCVMAAKMKQAGTITAEQIEEAGDEFRRTLIATIKSIYENEAKERKQNNQEN